MLYLLKLLFPAVLVSHFAAANALDVHLPSLTAVTFQPAVEKREEAFILKRDCDLHYADRMSPRQMKIFI